MQQGSGLLFHEGVEVGTEPVHAGHGILVFVTAIELRRRTTGWLLLHIGRVGMSFPVHPWMGCA